MNDNVILMSEFSIKPGELGNFKALVKEIVDAIQVNEPDTLIYEILISEDDKSCHFMERYVDSDAVMTHVGNFREQFSERFWAFLEPKGFKVFGNPSDDLKEALSGVGVVILVARARDATLKLQSAGINVELREYDGVGHTVPLEMRNAIFDDIYVSIKE